MHNILPQTKRYYQFSEYLKERFGCKVYKVTIDAGFTCPNRDGKLGWGGCTYCNNMGFSANGTRPDCAPEPVLDLIESYQTTRDVWVEYGLQSIHDKTLQVVNRGHDYSTFLDALERTKRRGLKVCVHVILGLPGESHADMMATAQAVGQMDIESLKIHLMHVLKDTPIEKELNEGRFKTLEFDEYVNLVCDFLEYIPQRISIQRLTADGPRSILLAPKWATQKRKILAAIDAELEHRSSQQGFRLV
ncbi:MAG: TIGR01212 family radical SAM protein [Candidatus Lindowbacteria bacterium]|nr:TIGR01212 family radical SAM protein [Candidatus Lindowbacteria bacterium]